MIKPSDERQLADRGVSPHEARRQLELLTGARYTELIRPCTVSDGIRQLGEDEIAELHALHAEATGAGRFVKFVPASGAASRMFDSVRANPASFLERCAFFGV